MTRIDPSEHWIGGPETAYLLFDALPSASPELRDAACGWGEEFDLVAATLSEAPPGLEDVPPFKLP